ncbi:MAG: amino acid permease [Hyphomicrobiaceae bacterium]
MTAPPVTLKRSVGLWLAVLYGVGVTVGAGIYVLIGAAAGRAGLYAPVAFVVSGLVMGLTACSYAELVGRHPVSAGEAAYVREGFRSEGLSLLVGFLVILASIVAAAAITNGSVGYIQTFVPADARLLAVIVLLVMGAIAAIGMLTSAWVAGVMTLIEVGGLLIVIGTGLRERPGVLLELGNAVPAIHDTAAWSAVMATTLLSFFAFIGFEGLVNIAEEVRRPERTLPLAIMLTLLITTLLYILVVWIALRIVPAAELGASTAPLALVFERATGAPPYVVVAIAIVATLNGIIAQIILAARVLYGLSVQGTLPAIFGRLETGTQTPVVSTVAATLAAIAFATLLPIGKLADLCSLVMLAIFAMVNVALLFIKRRGTPPPPDTFIVPTAIPVLAALSCVGLAIAALFEGGGL